MNDRRHVVVDGDVEHRADLGGLERDHTKL
jgi:hypothetical protein